MEAADAAEAILQLDDDHGRYAVRERKGRVPKALSKVKPESTARTLRRQQARIDRADDRLDEAAERHRAELEQRLKCLDGIATTSDPNYKTYYHASENQSLETMLCSCCGSHNLKNKVSVCRVRKHLKTQTQQINEN
jgi:exonuclease VII large subunit